MTNSDIRPLIQAAMRAAFPAAEDRVAQFYAMQEYHLGWRDINLQPALSDPGKLLRPQLVLLACQAVGGDTNQALPLAAGIQLLHDFSLIHDDIEDQSDARRGRITVWKQWGIAQGINAGDGMFTLAHLSLHRLSEAGVPAEVVLRVLRQFEETILTICEGQFLDLSFEGNLQITADDYLAMIARKTAALIAASAGLGSIVGGAHDASVQALFSFGQNLGLAFQIQDDVLGIWGEPEQTGKPRAADLYRRKVSLPVVYALRHAPRRADLERIYHQPELSDADVADVLAVLDEAEARAYTEATAATYHQAAIAALASVQCGADPAAQAAHARMMALAEGLVGRQH